MVQKFLKYGTTFCAVEHTVDKDSKEKLNFLQLKKQQKELVIASKYQFDTIEKLFPVLKPQKHLFLIINNQQVLFKKSNEIDKNQENLVKKSFPSLKLSEFYYEVLQADKHSFVAICRKDYVDNLIAQYEANGIAIVDFSLQNFVIQQLVPFLNENEINTSNSVISIQDNVISDIQKKSVQETPYNINNLDVTNNELLPLAGILSYYTYFQNNQVGFGELQNQLKQKQFHKRFYELGLKVALGSIFLILLINFMVFSSYRSEINLLDNELALNSNYKNALIQLQNNVSKKEKLVKSLTSLSSSKTSWVLNEIGKTVPKRLLLTDLEYQPLLKSIKKNKEVAVGTNQIIIKGISKSDSEFTKWIAALKEKAWVKNITILSYGKGKKTTTSFEYLITFTN